MIAASRAALLAGLWAAAFSPAVFAHGESNWAHQLLDGALLFFTAPASFLPVLLVALLAQRRRPRAVAVQAAVLALGLLAGILALPVAADPAAPGLYARGYLVAIGLLVLLNLRLHTAVVLLLVLVTGMLTGMEAGSAADGGLLGNFAGAMAFVLSAACLYMPSALIADRYPDGWQRIAMRVMGSWIAAIAVIDITFMIVRSA